MDNCPPTTWYLLQTSSHDAPRVGVTSAACLCDVTASSLRTEHSHFRLNFWLFRSLHHSVQVGGRSHQVQNVVSYQKLIFLLILTLHHLDLWMYQRFCSKTSRSDQVRMVSYICSYVNESKHFSHSKTRWSKIYLKLIPFSTHFFRDQFLLVSLNPIYP